MRLHEEFRIDEPVAEVWRFFEQPEAVAVCVPGVEEVTVIDADHVTVRATQSIGPMTATFDAKVTVFERIPNELIRFRAIGKSVRGAIGNVRTENAVQLVAEDGATTVLVDGDVVLAGALGSVGQKVVAKQAGRLTAEFAQNLQRALAGDTPPRLADARGTAVISGDGRRRADPTAGSEARGAAPADVAPGRRIVVGSSSVNRPDRWSRIAAVLSAASVLLNVVVLVRQRRGAR
jgi:carbon monoxide dehydrogenase subunit G